MLKLFKWQFAVYIFVTLSTVVVTSVGHAFRCENLYPPHASKQMPKAQALALTRQALAEISQITTIAQLEQWNLSRYLGLSFEHREDISFALWDMSRRNFGIHEGVVFVTIAALLGKTSTRLDSHLIANLLLWSPERIGHELIHLEKFLTPASIKNLLNRILENGKSNDLSHFLRSKEIFSDQERLDTSIRISNKYKFWSSDSARENTLHNLIDFAGPLLTQETRLKIISTLLATEGATIVKQHKILEEAIQLLPDSNPEEILKSSVLIAEGGYLVPIGWYKLLDISEQKKLCAIMTAHKSYPRFLDVYALPEYPEYFNHFSREDRFQVAISYAENNPYNFTLIKSINNFRLGHANLFKVLKVVFSKFASYSIEFTTIIDLLNNHPTILVHERFELAKIRYTEFRLPGNAIELRKFKLTPELYLKLFRFFLYDKKQRPDRVAQIDRVLSLFDAEMLPANTLRRYRDYFAPTSAIKKEGSANTIIRDRLEHIHTIEDFVLFISENSQRPNIKRILEIATDQVKRVEVIKRLVPRIIRYQARNHKLPENSMQLIAHLMGLNYLELSKIKLSENSMGDLYSIVLDLSRHTHAGFFTGVSIDPKVYKEPTKLILLLSLMRDLVAISGNDRETALTVFKLIRTENINENFLDQKIRELREKFNQTLKNLFADLSADFKYEQFMDLQNKWGDLEPIFTLLARFNGENDWKSIIPLLTKVFEVVLKNQFFEFKFQGNRQDLLDVRQARDQLAMLTENAKRAWMQNITTAQIAKGDNTGLSKEQIDEHLAKIINNELIEHTQFKTADHIERYRLLFDEVAEFKDNPNDGLKTLKEKYFSEETSEELIVQKIFSSLLSQTIVSRDLSKLRKVCGFIEFLVKRWPKLVPAGQQKQVITDLQAIKSLVVSVQQKAQSQKGILVSVISHDPKLLLTIGDIVPTTSCQNYKTGSYIDTLLGYVIDANVKAQVGFHLDASSFNHIQDFENVYAAMQGDGLRSVEFDGAKRIVTFHLPSGLRIESVSLPFAYLRRIIKVGFDPITRDPMLVVEPDFKQLFSYTNQLLEMQSNMFARLSQLMAARIGMPITIVGSRSSHGHYSDHGAHNGGGKKTETYTIIKDKYAPLPVPE